MNALRATIDRLAALPCDVAMAAHPDQLPEASDAATTRCAAYADQGRENLRKRLEKERNDAAEPARGANPGSTRQPAATGSD